MTIDIIIPVYNGRKHLRQAVDSALECTGSRVILVDDGSTDGTAALCDGLAKQERVTVIHRENGGASAARNTGLDAAKAEFVTFLDADDALLPGALAALLGYMPGLDALQGRVVRKAAPIPAKIGLQAMSAELALEKAMMDPTAHLHCHGWIFRREMLTERFNESLTLGEDGEWMLRTLRHAAYAAYADCPCYRYSVRQDSTLRSASNVSDRYLATLRAAQPALSAISREQAAAHYVLTHLLLSLTHGVFRGGKTGRSWVRCRRICGTEPYRSAFAHADLTGHSPRMIVLRLLKKGHAAPAWAAIKLRQMYNRLMNHER